MAVKSQKMRKNSWGHKMGCGLMGAFFGRRSILLRKTSVHSLTMESTNNVQNPSTTVNSADNNSSKPPVQNHSRRQRSKSETAFPDSSKPSTKHTRRHSLVPVPDQKSEARRASDAARSSSSPSVTVKRSQIKSDSKELSCRTVKKKYPEAANNNKSLARATSSNVMLLAHLGNLRQVQSGGNTRNNDFSSPTSTVENLQEMNAITKPRIGYGKVGENGVLGNIIRQSSTEGLQWQGMVTRIDHEVLKKMGNEKYKQGKFEESLELYDRAISLDSSNAIYRSNKSAALIGLGRLMDAVWECKEAIRLHPYYQRAHHRLATLCVRLGEAEKALHHYKQSGPFLQANDIHQAEALQKHLNKCIEAKKLKDWNTLLKETELANSTGADSAPQVYAMKAEALLKLERHQEAYSAYLKGPNFGIDACAKFYGVDATSHFLIIGVQVYMTGGSFEDAMEAAKQAARLNPGNQEVSRVVSRAKAVASARHSGNLLFRASKFSEACIAYSEGLEHDLHNAILLCNRAACRSKLGQFEKAVEDCTAALYVQPNYSKARLRRADCNAKLERWEASIQDYEMLIRESPADEEVGRALFEAQVQRKKQRGEDTTDLKFGSNLVFVSSNERFRHFVTSTGMSVVLFCSKANDTQVLQLMEPVRKRFPCVNFLKVEVEDHPYLAKSERVTSLPSFNIYKNGSRVKEIPGNNRELLEKSVKLYSC